MFTYDRYGNRLTHAKFSGTNQLTHTAVTHPAIDPNTNRFQSGQGYLFDKNGNLTTDAESRSFVLNGDNRQKEIRDGSNNLVGEYFYDGEGRRIKKKAYVNGVLDEETIFVYSSGKLIAEYSSKPPAQNPTTSWTITDQLGSPRVLVNTLGEVISRRDFLPFGEEIIPEAANLRTNAALKYNGDGVRQKFTGYQKDEESGLDFAEARMYENRHGRFTAVDPLLASGKSANPQTFNRYVYVINNPLIHTDPSGLQVAKVPDGRWYRPTDPDGVKTYRFESTQPEGYEPVTERDRKGRLIGAFNEGLIGDQRYWVLAFDERGPLKALPTLDMRSGKAGMYQLTDDERNGFSVIKGPDFRWTGAVENAIEPIDVALFATPFKGVSGGSRFLPRTAPEAAGASTWNQFQKATAGQFASRAEAAEAWSSYKIANGITSNAVTRDLTQRSLFLRNAADSGMYPKWMNQWLRKGQTPPGYSVDHIKPLSIGGADVPSNMRLLDNNFHFKIHHRYYRPWED